MKYFEVVEPYYALLKADNKLEAKSDYNSLVADLEDIEDIFEVPEEYALARFSQVPGEDKKLVAPKIIAEEFVKQENKLLIIDGHLI